MPLARLPWPWVWALTRPGMSSRSLASITTASAGAASPGAPIAAMASPSIRMSAGRRDRRLEGEGDAARHRDVHEEVERRRRLGRREAERGERGGEVVGAA